MRGVIAVKPDLYASLLMPTLVLSAILLVDVLNTGFTYAAAPSKPSTL